MGLEFLTQCNPFVYPVLNRSNMCSVSKCSSQVSVMACMVSSTSCIHLMHALKLIKVHTHCHEAYMHIWSVLHATAFQCNSEQLISACVYTLHTQHHTCNIHIVCLHTYCMCTLYYTSRLWRVDEGYPALACRRQHINNDFSGADTLTTAVWVPIHHLWPI